MNKKMFALFLEDITGGPKTTTTTIPVMPLGLGLFLIYTLGLLIGVFFILGADSPDKTTQMICGIILIPYELIMVYRIMKKLGVPYLKSKWDFLSDYYGDLEERSHE